MQSSKEIWPASYRFCLGLIACVCTALAGCGSGTPIEASGSEEQAQQAVREALDGWKSGQTLSDFTAAQPKSVVADEEWQAGTVLTDYKLAEPPTLNGSHWRQKVELQTKGKSKSKPTVVYYAVTLGDKTSILRSDFQY